MEDRFCLDCNEILQGRIDKKFCSEYCKSSFHYKARQALKPTFFKKVDNHLKTNRRILKAYNKAGKATVRKQILINEGFHPRFFTHYWKADNGNVYFFCYEFGFMEIKENNYPKYILIKWQAYMEKKFSR